MLSDHCFGRICASSQSVRGDGGNACHWHAFEITSFRARNMSRLRDCRSLPVPNRSRRRQLQDVKWNATPLLPMLRVRLHRRARCWRIPIDGHFLDFRDHWGNRIENVGYDNIEFTKAPNVLRVMELTHLTKNESAKKELAKKGMALERD
jgi:hypothetical protein